MKSKQYGHCFLTILKLRREYRSVIQKNPASQGKLDIYKTRILVETRRNGLSSSTFNEPAGRLIYYDELAS